MKFGKDLEYFIFIFKKIFFFSLMVSILILIKAFTMRNKKYIKVCVCTCGKGENRYIREFVSHYINYGVDKIFIYDNNDINGERFEMILKDYLKNNSIKIINYRGKLKIQMDVFNDCYEQLKTEYDWFFFFDIDEFIHLKNFQNVKDYLNQYHFIKCNAIYLSHKLHTDNNQISYYNNSLANRFPKIYEFDKFEKNSVILHLKYFVKAILRGNLTKIKISNPHLLSPDISQTCNGNGKIIEQYDNQWKSPEQTYYYFDHYYFKSCEEYLHKLSKGSVFYGKERKINIDRLITYFAFNKLNEKKLHYFIKNTNLNLNMSFFKTKLLGIKYQ